ncbi:MAG: hypothetical protein ABEL51_15670 [Salinibacter sp.]
MATATPPSLATTHQEWRAKILAGLRQSSEFMNAYLAATPDDETMPPDDELPDPIYVRMLWRLAGVTARYDNIRRLLDDEQEQTWSANEDARDPRVVENTRYATGIGQTPELKRLEGKDEGARLHLEDLLTIAEDLGILEWQPVDERWAIVAPDEEAS